MTTVLFATEYDAAHVIVNILCKNPGEHLIFPIIVKYKPSKNVYFCMQTQKCRFSKRLDTVFICDQDSLNFSFYVTNALPIKSDDIVNSLNDEETENLYKELLLLQNPDNKNIEFRSLVFFYKTLMIKHLTNKYIMPTSPFWFLSTYGQTEGMLLLTMYYYLFEEQKSTIATTKNYVQCFSDKLGDMVFTYSSMSEFITITLKSNFRKQCVLFSKYAKQKNLRDREEFLYLDKQIDIFRNNVCLTNSFLVHYIYIAYSTALEKKKLITYSNLTSYNPALPIESQCQENMLILGNSLYSDLISVMKKYFNEESYFQNYVDIKRFSSDQLNVEEYLYKTRSEKNCVIAINSDQICKLVNKCNKHSEGFFSPLKPNLQGLLKILASKKTISMHGQSVSRREYIHKTFTHPIPLFRVQLLYKNVYCLGNEENWYKNMGFTETLQFLPDEYVSDEILTSSFWLQETNFLSEDVDKQFYATRHEIFNEYLPVTNYIGDLDLPLQDSVMITESDFFAMCRLMRNVFIKAWQEIFPEIDTESHPIFFFKSDCNNLDRYAESDLCLDAVHRPFCTCRKKIGLRISIPVPCGKAIIGSEPLKQISKIFNHLMCLNQDLIRILNSIIFPGECFDVGIYNTGRCIRVGYMYKVDQETKRYLYGRLKPIFIVPQKMKIDYKTFVQMQLDLNNILHHGTKSAKITEIVYNISDRACPKDFSFIDSRAKQIWHKKNITLESLCLKYLHLHGFSDTNSLSYDDLLVTFTRSIAWPQIMQKNIQHCESRIVSQFQHITFIKTDAKNVQIKKIQNGKLTDFNCLTRNHKGNRENVLVFLEFKVDGNRILIILWSTCFTTKCKSNTKQVHSSISLDNVNL
ncbi:helicase-primase primase subunit [macacine betaherpesvirus 9]|uniref:Helicase-primase primase subunit n=1 Tax=macacine betaherpesvirus 9 TaxID=2560568 RepID=A0A191S3S5_9BETA|nr:helicase-primase primase subunit [macacine betaherpesvirus 9]ANC96524.1 helicase-primase primase subunit [macacine betaherpesvirus 9]